MLVFAEVESVVFSPVVPEPPQPIKETDAIKIAVFLIIRFIVYVVLKYYSLKQN